MEFVETPIFSKQVQAAWSDVEYRALQFYLILRPDAGKIIPGSGGLRKIRWQMSGRGKRGGARIIYYWQDDRDRVYLLFMYPKNVRSNLSRAELAKLRKLMIDK